MLLGNRNWDPYGESLWSIFTKLTLRNRFSFAELKKVFGEQGARRPLDRNGHKDLNTITGIDPTALLQTIELESTMIRMSTADPYQIGRDKPATELRHCACCLENGFHSPVHQVLGNTHCILHDQRLELGCPTCGASIDYELNGQFVTSPNRCVNGHKILELQDFGRQPTGLEVFEKKLLDDYVQSVTKISTFFGRHGSMRLRPLFSDYPHDDQIPILARRLNIDGKRPTVEDRIFRSPIEWRATRYKLLPRGGVRRSKEERAIEMQIRSNDGEVIPELFKKHWVDGEFRKSVDRVIARIRRTVLAKHDGCVGLLYGPMWPSYEKGLSCVWRTAYTIWRIKHEDCLYAKGRSIEDTHRYMISWNGIADNFLSQPKRGWAAHRDLRTFLFLATRYTEYSLMASYWSILRTIISEAPNKGSHAAHQLVENALKSEPKCTYLVGRSASSGSVSLFVDDEFWVRETSIEVKNAGCSAKCGTPSGMNSWRYFGL